MTDDKHKNGNNPDPFEDARKNVSKIKHAGLRKFGEAFLGLTRGLAETSQEIGEAQLRSLEQQIKDIMGPWAQHVNERDKVSLISATMEERTQRLLDLRKNYESAFAPDPNQPVSESKDELDSAIPEMLRSQIKSAEALLAYERKVLANLDWEYRDDPEKKEQMKMVYKHIFLRFREESGW